MEAKSKSRCAEAISLSHLSALCISLRSHDLQRHDSCNDRYAFKIRYRDDDVFCLAYLDNKVIGISRLSRINPDCLFLDKIFVRRAHRGVGPIAKWLLENLINAGRTTNKAIHGSPLNFLSRRNDC